MGRSGKSRKTDKETQSPMLKIFKDIMQRQNDDPEKRNLLKESHQDTKKKQYSNSKSKSDHITVDSSGSERRIRTIPHKTHEQRNLEYEQDNRQSIPFQSEKKESWWLWGDNEKAEREESFSCVSCALKKLVSSEFMCVGCLLTVFTLSVVVTFLLVFRNVPIITTDDTELLKYGTNTDSERLKRKIDLIKGIREFNSDLPERKKKPWDNSILRPFDGLSAISEDFAMPSFRDLSNLESGSSSAELSSLLGGNNLFELQNSDRLREFYKKLIQTDAQINMLKKATTDYTILKTDDERFKNILERTKRSINLHKQSKMRIGGDDITKRNKDDTKQFSKIEKDNSGEFNMKKNNANAIRNAEGIEKSKISISNEEFTKSKSNYLDNQNKINTDTKGIIIEKNKFLWRYKPEKGKKVPKCSHAPKEAKSHEKQLKHPFYKNTQRLDDLLDRFMEKGLPGILADSFGTDVLSKNRCKHPNVDGVSVTDKAKSKAQTSKQINNNDIYEFTSEPSVKTTNEYDMVLSRSTLLNSEFKNPEDLTSVKYLGTGFNHRKLMQANEVDEENLGYEDLKEVLMDDLEGHDDTDNRGERTKRNEDSKSKSSGAHNQNWKGPIPLYPDEINSMIKQAVIGANNPAAFKTYEADSGLDNKEKSSETENTEHNVGDVQYIEDYIINKYDKLAQAYSDYGVLDGKKETERNEKDEGVKTGDNRVKLSIDKGIFKGGFFDRLKKGTHTSEGFRFEVKPLGSTQSHRDDNPMELYKYIQKHVKISHDNNGSPSIQTSTVWPTNEDLELMYTPKKYEKTNSIEELEHKYKNIDPNKGSLFAINKGKRSLKSFNDDSELNGDIQIGTNIFNYEDNSEDISKNYNHSTLKFNHSILGPKHYLLKREMKNDTYFSQTNKSMNRTNSVKSNFNNNTYSKEICENKSTNSNGEQNLSKNNFTGKVNDGMSLSDFFTMLANFFSFLDSVEINGNKTNTILIKNDKFVTSSNTSENSTEIFYPLYDSEIIENIEHRSRVLLSVKEENLTETKISHIKDVHLKEEDTKGITTTESTLQRATNVINNSLVTPSNVNNPSMETTLIYTNEDSNLTDPKNKNIVKRNADDVNLIFWNDMYDEEYGIDVDHLENNVRDKHSAKINNIVKSSSDWLRDKVRILNDHFRKKTVKDASYGKQRTSNAITKSRSTTTLNKINKRDLNFMSEDVDSAKIDFAALTANMKEVCRKAAKAVQNTRNLEAREDSKESAVASSLMQQLVRLMTDLVDFQVQQRTCLKLPPDLQNFLEWLTGNSKAEDMKRDFGDLDNMLPLENVANYEKTTENYLELLTPVIDKDIQTLDRSDCLGTFHAVQDLIQQYEAMDEEDKSKMTGIKEYLESQLDYLQKRLNSVDDYNIYKKTDLPLRFRRHLIKNFFNRKNDPNIKRNLRKFVKNSGKKHTKTTASIKEDSCLNDRDKDLKLRSHSVKMQSVTKSNFHKHLNDRYLFENKKSEIKRNIYK